ncbi:MAG TPA: Hsp33 family molecular chaperone HslO, partial [Clostridiales bacterium]|nr:Hsp33 family molecular chaperone HslO [Clostridiales bacterium]
NPDVMLPASDKGKLDVGHAVGKGFLRVIKDMGLKEPYTGQTDLVTGEIAEDLTYYYAASEQIPSAVALGVLMNKDNTVKHAGGFIIQLMPFADDSIIDKLEDKINSLDAITKLFDKGMSAEEILEYILGDMGMEVHEKIPTRFLCNCDKERIEKALISIGEKDIKELIKENDDIEVNCHFCSTQYKFNVDELSDILVKAMSR